MAILLQVRPIMARHTRRGRTGGGRARTDPRQPSRWFARAPKNCAETRSSGIAASPVRPSEEVTRPYASRLSQSRELWAANA
jgi:hypothetical protein